MKIIKTALGWEIQPESSDEHYHLSWFIDWLRPTTSLFPVVEDEAVPVGMIVSNEMLRQAAQTMIKCPQCNAIGAYNGTTCRWCGYGLIKSNGGVLPDGVLRR